jgi:hypothetical protein
VTPGGIAPADLPLAEDSQSVVNSGAETFHPISLPRLRCQRNREDRCRSPLLRGALLPFPASPADDFPLRRPPEGLIPLLPSTPLPRRIRGSLESPCSGRCSFQRSSDRRLSLGEGERRREAARREASHAITQAQLAGRILEGGHEPGVHLVELVSHCLRRGMDERRR